MDKIILGKARYDEVNKRFNGAVAFYNVSRLYYQMNHFTSENQELYFEVLYRNSLCYIEKGDKEEAVKIMLNGLTSIHNEYGVLSKESAYFSRKYLIDFYLYNDCYSLAFREYQNLLAIFKTIGYNANEMSDIIRLRGDLYYQHKDYDKAASLYKRAYAKISKQNDIDYDVYAKIITRIADYDIATKSTGEAIELYKTSLDKFVASGKKQEALTAQLALNLGDIYAKDSSTTKQAITCYEKALKIIKSLPNSAFLKQNITTYLKTLKGLYNDDGQFHKVEEVDVELARKRRFTFLD